MANEMTDDNGPLALAAIPLLRQLSSDALEKISGLMIRKRIQISNYVQLRKLRPVAGVLIFVLCSSGLLAQKKKKTKAAPEGTPVLWQEPTDIASRDLF